MKYWLCSIYFIIPLILLSTRKIWVTNTIDNILVIIPWIYLSITSCIIRYNISTEIKYKKRYYNILKEVLRWIVLVMLLYKWFNIYMITLIHSIIWVWCMIYILQPKIRITYI